MTLLSGCGGRVVFVREFPDNILFVMNDTQCICDEYRIYRGSLQYENSSGILAELTQLNPEARDDLDKDAMERLETVKALRLYAESAGITLNHEEEGACLEMADRFCRDNTAYSNNQALAADIFRELVLSAKAKESIMSRYAAEISDDEARVVTVLEFFAPFENYSGQEEARSAAAGAAGIMSLEEYAGTVSDEAVNTLAKALEAEYPSAEIAKRRISRSDADAETVMLVFDLEDGEASQILLTEKGCYAWYCISAYDQALCDENKQQIMEGRRQEVYAGVLADFVAGLDFSLDQKQFERLLSEEDTALASSVFEISGTFRE